MWENPTDKVVMQELVEGPGGAVQMRMRLGMVSASEQAAGGRGSLRAACAAFCAERRAVEGRRERRGG